MDKVELVCVICKKEDRGSGVWSYHDSPSTWEKEDGLCPDCSQELFPQFYSSYKIHAKRRFRVGKFLFSVFNQLRSDVNSTH